MNESIDNILRSYRLRLEALGRSPHTIRQYTDAAKRLCTWAAKEPASITEDDILAWMAARRREGRKGTTIRHDYNGLKAFFAWHADRFDTKDPMERVPVPGMDEPVRPVLPVEDVLMVLRSLDRQRRRLQREMPQRDAAIISLLFDTGMRVSELCNIRNGDINWDECTILLPETKNHDPRLVVFSPATGDRILTMRDRGQGGDDYLFRGYKGKLTRSGVLQMISRTFARHGIDNVYPHRLRHSWATHFLEHPEARVEDLMVLAGWKSEGMAKRYTQTRSQARALAAGRRHSPLA